MAKHDGPDETEALPTGSGGRSAAARLVQSVYLHGIHKGKISTQLAKNRTHIKRKN